jgi:NAD(P)-dependent dehydrogenase (short-subunit alcohol dehydrogenase family)
METWSPPLRSRCARSSAGSGSSARLSRTISHFVRGHSTGSSSSSPAAPFASLQGRCALVTGVSFGSMGHGIAAALASRGCRVACVDVAAHELSLRQACDDVSRQSGRGGASSQPLPLVADCTDRQQLEAVFDEAVAAFGEQLHIVVAAVGGAGYTAQRAAAGQEVQDSSQFRDSDMSETGSFTHMIQTTQWATYHTCQCAARRMLRHRSDNGGDGRSGGRIIVIGSVMVGHGSVSLRWVSDGDAFVRACVRACVRAGRHGSPRLRCLRCLQGSSAAVHESARHRAGTGRDHVQRDPAWRDGHHRAAARRADHDAPRRSAAVRCARRTLRQRGGCRQCRCLLGVFRGVLHQRVRMCVCVCVCLGRLGARPSSDGPGDGWRCCCCCCCCRCW